MHLQKGNPALAARGIPNTDLLESVIVSEFNTSVRPLQESLLTRRYAISTALAAAVAPLVFGEGGR